MTCFDVNIQDQLLYNWIVVWNYDLVLCFFWNLCKLQTSSNYKQFLALVEVWIQLNNATLLRHLFSTTQFINLWKKRIPLSIS